MFSPYILNVSVRPRLEDFGETLFNAVAILEEEFKKEEQKRLEQEKIKKKGEELEAIKNYKKLKESNKQLKDDYKRAINKLVVHKSDNTSLRKQLEETKSKSNALVPRYLFDFQLSVKALMLNFGVRTKSLRLPK